MDCRKVGELILSLRKEKDMTQKEVADAMNISDDEHKGTVPLCLLFISTNTTVGANPRNSRWEPKLTKIKRPVNLTDF